MLLWVLIVLVLYLLRSVLTFSLTEPVISYAHAALSVLTARLSLHFPAQCSLGPEQFPAGASLKATAETPVLPGQAVPSTPNGISNSAPQKKRAAL